MVTATRTERSWYEVRAAAGGVTDIFLYDEISAYGVSAKAFVAALGTVKTAAINVFINSPGGSADDSISMYHALRRHPARVNTIVDGICASAATIVLQAGDHRKMMAGSSAMVHDPWSGLAAQVVGNAGDMRDLSAEAAKQANYLDMMSRNIATIYTARCGGTEAGWLATMAAETWYDAPGAVAANLADEVVTSATIQNRAPARTFNLSRYRHAPAWAQRTEAAPVRTVDYAQARTDIQTHADIARGLGVAAADRAMREVQAKRHEVAPTAESALAVIAASNHLSVDAFLARDWAGSRARWDAAFAAMKRNQ